MTQAEASRRVSRRRSERPEPFGQGLLIKMQRPLAKIRRILLLTPLFVLGTMWARSHFVCDTLTLEEQGEVPFTFKNRVWTIDHFTLNQRSVGSFRGRLRLVMKLLAIQQGGKWVPLRAKTSHPTVALTTVADGELPETNDDYLDHVTMTGSAFLPVIRYRYFVLEFSYWQLAAVAATPELARLGGMAFKRYRSLRRKRHGLCPQCGYNLAASRGRCPECGAGA